MKDNDGSEGTMLAPRAFQLRWGSREPDIVVTEQVSQLKDYLV